MTRIARYFVLLFSAILFAGMIPQADAQIVVNVGHRHHHRRYYHHHRHYR